MAASLLCLAIQLCHLSQVRVDFLTMQRNSFPIDRFSMMMFHSFQQFLQQVPVITTTNLIHMISDNHRPPVFDPLAEIRNGNVVSRVQHRFDSSHFSSIENRFGMASVPGGNH